MCVRCGDRRAIYLVRGRTVKADDDHDLCPRCWRALCDRQRVANTNTTNPEN